MNKDTIDRQTMQLIQIPFGMSQACARIPSSRLAWILHEEVSYPEVDIYAETIHAIEHPVGSLPLRNILAHTSDPSVLILIDDNTRSTPQHLILPTLLDAIRSYGIQPDRITIMVCLGTHRPLSNSEMIERVGLAFDSC